jgi:putative transposase
MCANGSAFRSAGPAACWGKRARRNATRLDFIRPRKPIENAYIESFNGRLSDECLNVEIFFSIEDARRKLERWRIDYNAARPHSSLGNLAPIEFEKQSQENRITKSEILNL